MLDLEAELALIRTDFSAQPCRTCGQQTQDVWALTHSDTARLYYAEYRACSTVCAEALAQETLVAI